MDFVAQLVTDNVLVLFFAYGLAFFVMGLAIALESPRSSGLPLAGSLNFLALFGMLLAFAEWTRMFLLIMMRELSINTIVMVHAVQILVLAIAGLCLLEFGVGLLLSTTPKHALLSWLTGVLFVCWAASAVSTRVVADSNARDFLVAADVLARYLFYIPGSLLAALALLSQRAFLQEMKLPQAARDCTLTAYTFIAFAVLGGVIVPPSSDFPPVLMDTAFFYAWTGVPVEFLRAISALFMAYFVIRILRVFQVESTRKLDEANHARFQAQQEALQIEREAQAQLRQRARELSALYEVSKALSATPDLHNLLDITIRKVVETFPGVSRAALYLYDEQRRTLVPAAHFGYGGPIEPVLAGDTVLNDVFRSGQVELLTPKDPNHPLAKSVPALCRSFFGGDATDFRWIVCAPVISRGTVVGSVLLMNLDNPVEFEKSDLRLLEAIADHIGVAVENARLVQGAGQAEALREADRLKSEFLSTVTHELRTPLASIKGFVTTLLQDDVEWDRSSQRDFLGTVNEQADRLSHLVDDLLDISRIEAGGLRLQCDWCNLRDIVNSALRRLGSLTDTHPLRVLCPPDLPSAWADSRRVEQVLANLLENAAKYSASGGEIAIEAGTEDGQLVVSVADHGVGIAPEHQDKVFGRFFRVPGESSQKTSGTGLGLAICRGIVEAHGGRMWVESQLGQGSRFSFTLLLSGRSEGGQHKSDESASFIDAKGGSR